MDQADGAPFELPVDLPDLRDARPRETVFTAEKELPAYAARIARLLDVPFVVFGHTHVPTTIPLFSGATYINSGTWAPIWQRDNQERLKPGLRNVVRLSLADGEPTELSLESWVDSAGHGC